MTALTSQLPLTTVHEERPLLLGVPTRAMWTIAAAALAWEDEVGHRSADDEPDVETDRGEHASIGLSRSELLRRFFFLGGAPRAESRAIGLPVAVSKESRKEARS